MCTRPSLSTFVVRQTRRVSAKRAPLLENCMDNDKTKEATTNADPITGAPGAHPVGVGLGAAAGGVAGGIAAGAAVGTVAAGPVGTVVGAAVGAIAGGLGGKAVAEHFDPTTPTTEVTSTEPDLRTTTLPHLEKAVGDMAASS